jgi:hypothetical protein
MNRLVPIASPTLPSLVAVTGERAGTRFLATIRNPHAGLMPAPRRNFSAGVRASPTSSRRRERARFRQP